MKTFKQFIKDDAPTMSVAAGNIAGFDFPPVSAPVISRHRENLKKKAKDRMKAANK